MSDSDDEQQVPTMYDEDFFKNRAHKWVNEDLYQLDDSGNYMTRSKQWVVSHIQITYWITQRFMIIIYHC